MESLQVTTDYSKFVIDKTNRPLDIAGHKKLKQSLMEFGFSPAYPIHVVKKDGKLSIKDGQHRFTFAEQLGLPVYYIVWDKEIDLCGLNDSVVKWRPVDYALSYAHQGRDDYFEVLEMSERYGIAPITCAAMLSGTIVYSNVEKRFKAGDLAVKDRIYANLVGRIYHHLWHINKEVKTSRLVEAIMRVCRVPGFDPDRIIGRASTDPHLVVKCATSSAYVDMLERIYNYRHGDRFPLAFATEEAMKNRSACAATN